MSTDLNGLVTAPKASKFCTELVGFKEILFRGHTSNWIHSQHIKAGNDQEALDLFERFVPAGIPIGIRDSSYRGDSFKPILINTSKYKIQGGTTA